MFKFFNNLYDRDTNEFYSLCLNRAKVFSNPSFTKQGEFEAMILIGFILAPKSGDTFMFYINKLRDSRKDFDVKIDKKECLELINQRVIYYNRLFKEIVGYQEYNMELWGSKTTSFLYSSPLSKMQNESNDIPQIIEVQLKITDLLKQKSHI
ncbi:hypothetical protein DI487_10290 [Flavobacterium sediminis]|uniref:Uncharacterized protein n=2 Tax=Flavobacterium sediminis TaxID=2201181 RepID=A0A2U8QVY9_9FLAO|nr:hypothetical protein DI487_10290 [Flavobacterium sediminis]